MSTGSARDHFVYRVFNAEGCLLYVGCSMRPSARWKQHCVQRPGFRLAGVKFRVQGPYTKPVARQIERDALHTEAPLLGQATRTRAQHAEHLEAERRFTELPHLPGPVMEWLRFEARPLDGFDGYWRAFSFGQPTAVISGEQMADWRLKEMAA